MTKIGSRIFAMSGAILFLITGSALTIAVIVSIYQSSHQSTTPSTPTTSTKSSSKSKLQGTKLANFTPTNNITKLTYQDTTPGTGAVATAGGNVTVVYTGAVASTGIIFQSSSDTGSPVSFSLSQVIPGWQEGIPGMKVGGTRRLFIPANLAYGANPPAGSGIPANAALVFDVTLLKVN